MADDTPSSVQYELDGNVAVITLDDGKANAIGPATLDALDAHLDRAETEATALVLVGGAKMFSAGFDLTVMASGVQEMRALVGAGGRFWMRLYGSTLPTVAACTGHALAGGAVTLLACDERIGPSDRPAKVGLNEVAIGMPLPVFVTELAKDRLAPTHLIRAALGTIHDPAAALEAGFLDRLVPGDEVVATALARGHELSALRRGAVGRTKTALRQATIDHVLATLDDDMASMSAPEVG